MSKQWDNELPSCFGIADFRFAWHKSEEIAACSWLAAILRNGTSDLDVENQVRSFLASKNCTEPHINEQLARVQRLIYPWISKD